MTSSTNAPQTIDERVLEATPPAETPNRDLQLIMRGYEAALEKIGNGALNAAEIARGAFSGAVIEAVHADETPAAKPGLNENAFALQRTASALMRDECPHCRKRADRVCRECGEVL